MNELEALLSLTHIPFLGPIKIKLLIEYFGSAAQAARAHSQELQNLPGFGPKILAAWDLAKKNDCAWKKDLEWANRLNVALLPYFDPAFPKPLLEIADPPLLLYVKGEMQKRDQQGIAIVGTRQPSIYGREIAYKISADLAQQGITVVSGLARGIDTAAHQGALRCGRTVAVIGSGLAAIYPQENQTLAKQISEKGALISEFSMTTPPHRQNFPRRNRIVSGMCPLGILLIEAPLKSGAMITMRLGKLQGRPLYALPGRVDGNFQGNHQLIKQGDASLVENSHDLLKNGQNLFCGTINQTIKQENIPFLENEEKILLKQLPSQEFSLEEIVQITKMPMKKISVLLMSLILKGIIKEYPGKLYSSKMSFRQFSEVNQ